MSEIIAYFKRQPPPHEGIAFTEPSLTQQHFAEEVDINNLIGRYVQSGVLPEKQGAFYADFSSGLDYRETLEVLKSAREEFDALPAVTRAHFNNDPGALIDFVSDPNNHSRFAEFGLTEASTSSSLDVTGTTDTNVNNQHQETSK